MRGVQQSSLTSRQSGFTLIEVLVTVVLITIIVGITTLSVGVAGPERHAEQEARRLVLMIQEQCDEALLHGLELGMRFEPEGYRFSVWADQDWREFYRPPVFEPHGLPPGFSLSLEIQGAPVTLELQPDRFDPHVLCYSSGEATAFEAVIQPPPPTPGMRVVGELDGRARLGGWVETP